jgi:transketolase
MDPMPSTPTLDQLSINTIRMLAADAVELAGVGHLGTPLGAAPIAYAIWNQALQFDPADPTWPDRDRFVLSCGHAALLQYALLHLSGFDLPLEELRRFRNLGSMTPGHPEYGLTPGIETTTGPLGQGFSIAVGMAMAERFLAGRYNRPGHDIINHRTFALVSDGDMQEGVSSEAASLAGTLGLSRLIALYDDNSMQIEGRTDLAFREDVAARFRAYGWSVIEGVEGEEFGQLSAAIRRALDEREAPTLITVRTLIGHGSPVEDTAAAHHGPLGEDGLQKLKDNLGWPYQEGFFIPDEVRDHFAQLAQRGQAAHAEWQGRWEAYNQAFPGAAQELEAAWRGELPAGWEAALTERAKSLPPSIAPRKASESVLNGLAEDIPFLLGGAADLGPSTSTYIHGESDFSRENPSGRILHFGVREHAMAAAALGMTLHGGLRPFIATYLAFSDYMRPSLRLSAMMGQPVIYLFTHDSIAVGKDGPTHQPVEQLMSLRSIPNLVVFRPADSVEVAGAWKAALERSSGPTAILLARQNLTTLERDPLAGIDNTCRGGYILQETKIGQAQLLILATGSEVHLGMDVAKTLEADGLSVRVVSIPSWEVFDAQPLSYRHQVIPPDVTNRISIEAGITLGWEHYLGHEGIALGVNDYGASASEEDLYRECGLTVDAVVEQARRLIK